MLRSLFSGITGLRQHQTLMDVVSNNIANVNTTGFKGSTTTFEDTLSQTLRNAGLPTQGLGGLNPAQIGLGVQLGGITTNFRQGSAQNTGRTTDLMIQGDGFFVLENGVQQSFSRAGAFNFDTNGTLVNAEGMRVQGWMADATGVINSDGPMEDILVPAGTMIPPVATETVTMAGNITSGSATALTLGATVYDKSGVAHSVSIVLTPSGSTFGVAVTDLTDGTSVATAGTLAFTGTGGYDATNSTAADLTLADGSVIDFDMTGASLYGGPKSLSVTSVDGSSAGSLQQFQIQQDGTIVGVFSNQQKMSLGKLAMANFTNPSGLEKVGNTAFVQTSNSGLPQIGVAGAGGRGTLLASTLEMSNVDLAQEFTNMIIAQRGFQANSRVITTSDQMLQELVDLKR
ncbi:MAG: flagellar hook protein FlgE [Kineosporiaceae bacterium]|nr:flagellar hook protein FlgE [Kineosporiaceae bacterium]